MNRRTRWECKPYRPHLVIPTASAQLGPAVKLAEDQIYQPDVLFVSRDRLSLFERQGIFGPPDLVIEILSRSTASYDRGAKLRTYDRTGVREVWLIDPAGPQGTEILQRQGLRLQPVKPGPLPTACSTNSRATSAPKVP